MRLRRSELGRGTRGPSRAVKANYVPTSVNTQTQLMEKESLLPPTTLSTESLSSSGVDKKRPASKNYYVDLPDLTVTGLIPGEPITIERDCEHDLYAAKTISTYPWLASLNKRDGDPVADRFVMQIYKNRIVAAIADGCSWGPRAYNAALSAIAAFKDYMAARQDIVRDLPEGGHLLFRAFSEGHKRIVEGKEDVWDAGTTTLVGAILVEIPASWGLLVANLGDCKAFLYHKSTDEVLEVTAGNRLNIKDRRDPGGRLGPYLKNGTPDLRNLQLYFTQCSEGDWVILLSDGVHDNLDPEQMGLNPNQCELGLEEDDWTKLDHDRAEDAKNLYREMLLLRMIKQGHNTPALLTRELLRHCEELTKPSRQFMEANPNTPHPDNYKTFPGKMDHSTAVICIVPPHSKAGDHEESSSETSAAN